MTAVFDSGTGGPSFYMEPNDCCGRQPKTPDRSTFLPGICLCRETHRAGSSCSEEVDELVVTLVMPLSCCEVGTPAGLATSFAPSAHGCTSRFVRLVLSSQ